MLNFGPTFIWTAVNLLVLYFLLRRILFRPVTRFMENRAGSIRDAIETAERNKAESIVLKKEYERMIGNAEDEAGRILEAARAEAGKVYDDLLLTAKKDAEGVLTKAREEIEYERAAAMKAFKNKVVELSLLAATKVIEENMDNETNRMLVSRFIDEAGAM